jgi:hypothetical protein
MSKGIFGEDEATELETGSDAACAAKLEAASKAAKALTATNLINFIPG